MFVVSRNPIVGILALVVSLVIFGVMYFTVIKPSTDTANTAVKHSLSQADQAIKQSGFNTKGSSRTQKLASCIVTAGTDVGKVQACEARFGQ